MNERAQHSLYINPIERMGGLTGKPLAVGEGAPARIGPRDLAARGPLLMGLVCINEREAVPVIQDGERQGLSLRGIRRSDQTRIFNSIRTSKKGIHDPLRGGTSKHAQLNFAASLPFEDRSASDHRPILFDFGEKGDMALVHGWCMVDLACRKVGGTPLRAASIVASSGNTPPALVLGVRRHLS